MNLSDDKVSLVLDPLLTLEASELRQVPKCVAKTLIHLQLYPEVVLVKDPLPRTCLETFGQRVSQLSLGLVLDLWKTFLYHLETHLVPSSTTNKGLNLVSLCDPLMSTFLEYACIAEQGLPQRTLDKILASIKQTQTGVLTPLTTTSGCTLPLIQKSLIELCILIKNCHQVQIPEVLNIVEGSDKNLSGTEKILKRKLESIENVEEAKKTKVDLDDIFPDNLACLPQLVSEMSKLDLFHLAKLLVEKDELLNQFAQIVSEESRLQMALVITSLEQTNGAVSKKSLFKPFIAGTVEDSLSWLKALTNEPKLSKACETLKGLLSQEFNESQKIDPEKFQMLLHLFELLPLECLRGDLEAIISFAIVWMTVASKQDAQTGSQLVRVFSRCVDLTYRTPTILKFLDFSTLAPTIAKIVILPGDDWILEKVLQSLAKITSTYQKTLESLSVNVELFSEPLESLSNINEMRIATVLLEAVSRQLVNKDSSEDKKTVCKIVFKKIAKSPNKDSLKPLDSYSMEMKCLILRMFNAVLDGKTQAEADGISLKKWLKNVSCFSQFAIEQLSNTSKHFQGVCCKFLIHVWMLRKELPDLSEDFSSNLWSKLIDAENQLMTSVEGKTLVENLFLDGDEETLKKFADTLLSATSTTICEKNDMTYYMELWIIFVGLNLDENVSMSRRNILMQLLSVLHLEVPCHDQSYYKNILIPTLNFEASILETDKPLLHRESEAMCLMNSAMVSLEKVLQVSQDDFILIWKAIYRIVSSAFHKRSSAIVVPRIPLVLSVVRNLLLGLVKASEQTRKISGSELKEFVLLAHYIDRLCDHMRKLKEDFARVAPYFIADIIDCFQRVTLYTPVKSNLLLALHKLLDISDKHAVEMLVGILPVGRKDIFKHIITEYRKYFKYSGKV